eukprot:TRINITY_DN6744_c0_g1_i1.p1 TRINITY_DN6744_c0_g1~~TRINITY_DN6744_c0_g1_i1.p1  ORF type:complete len:318 (-),score=49.52 TRINITY_DN6744_c0_g1_i1:341-1219(-)
MDGHNIAYTPRDMSTTDGDTFSSLSQQSADDMQHQCESDLVLESLWDRDPQKIPLPFNISGVSDAFPAVQEQHAPAYCDAQTEQTRMHTPPPYAHHFEPICEPSFGLAFADYQADPVAFNYAVHQAYPQQQRASSKKSFEAATIQAVEMKRLGESALQQQYHKTKLCRFNQMGRCYLGENCYFAHTIDDLQSPPSLKKTKLCNNFFRHQCTKRDCNYAHGYKELRSTDVMYKTSYCRWFARNACRAGAHCRFAHHAGELRDAPPQEQQQFNGAKEACKADGLNQWFAETAQS